MDTRSCVFSYPLVLPFFPYLLAPENKKDESQREGAKIV
jgi:hypothetical protein